MQIKIGETVVNGRLLARIKASAYPQFLCFEIAGFLDTNRCAAAKT
ncbi:hypothetical protein SAMN05192553_106176 [Cyclobacterium xiamenense]|uniref:Uncharacterized protein n=1 Tax=Cyclobacterium xiamenense TaxID=1297121 RepID=A0A1H7AEB2_9BACT|nr:hypothetical protein SAMN05192553_106176 [Cyclobacterium xiamenense]